MNYAPFKFEKVSLKQYIEAWRKLGSVKSDEVLEEEWNNIKLPKRATKGSAGYDFFAPCDLGEITATPITIPTGIRWVTEEDGLYLMMVPRSGLGFKYRMKLMNTIGIIDSDYSNSDNEGHIMAKFRSKETFEIKQGDAFLQGIVNIFAVSEAEWNEELPERNGGFGSTDKK